MTTFNIRFAYTAYGDISVEAETFEEAEDKASKRLEELREVGSIDSPDTEITWESDEVEV